MNQEGTVRASIRSRESGLQPQELVLMTLILATCSPDLSWSNCTFVSNEAYGATACRRVKPLCLFAPRNAVQSDSTGNPGGCSPDLKVGTPDQGRGRG